MGLIFDTQRYDESITDAEIEIIDMFFDSLLWNKLDVDTLKSGPVLEVPLKSINYGQLMNLASTNNRFVYTGSLTTPPCTEKVYWNVINRIYPIKEWHLSAFRYLIAQQKRQETDKTKYKITSQGNYRNVQPIKKQDPKLMVVTPTDDSADDVAKTNHILTIILIFMAVVVAMLSGLIFMVLNG